VIGLVAAGQSKPGQGMPANPASASSSGENPGVQKTTEQEFKNIQILKGLPADQLIPAMQFITSSLGVGCDFCHVKEHPDRDDKKNKQIARKMMQMTMDLNRITFEGHRQVTCNTCHRGAAHPVGVPAIAAGNAFAPNGPPPEHGAESDGETPPGLPGADQLFDKYVQALGGAQAIEKLSTRVIQGNASFAGHDVAIDIFDKAGKRISIMHMPEGDSITAYDGHNGWLASPGRPLRDMQGAELDAARMDANLQLPVQVKGLCREWKVAVPEKIGELQTYQLVGLNSRDPVLRLYFDEASGLLVRLIRYADSPLGLNPTQIDYADYRDVGGVKAPYRWTIARPAGRFTIQAREIQHNVPVDDSKFLRPPAPEKAMEQK
jgi:hypothetical protein